MHDFSQSKIRTASYTATLEVAPIRIHIDATLKSCGIYFFHPYSQVFSNKFNGYVRMPTVLNKFRFLLFVCNLCNLGTGHLFRGGGYKTGGGGGRGQIRFCYAEGGGGGGTKC